MSRTIFILGLSLCALAPAAQAQSIFSARGFGVPVAPVDARAHALGGIGVGLFGRNPSFGNPAELADFNFRGIVATLQNSAREAELGGATGKTTSNRFPLLRVIYPVGTRLVTSMGYGSFLDQSWAVAVSGYEKIGTDSVAVRDLLSYDGGLAQFRVSLAYLLTPNFAVGIDGGLYTGKVDQSLSRTFMDNAPVGITPVQEATSWAQQAPLIAAGFRWDPASILRLAGSVTWAGDLKRTADAGSSVTGTERIQLPLQVAAGASAILTPGLLGTVSTRWSGWSRAADSFSPASAPVDTWEYGAGLEWSKITFGNTGIPVRVGYRNAQLPFRFNGVTPTEWAATLGLGFQLARTSFGPLATIDASIDHGRRTATGTGLGESFWRFTVGMGIFGR